MATNLTLEQVRPRPLQGVREHAQGGRDPRDMTREFHDHDGPGGKPTDVIGDEQVMRAMHKAMPNLRLTIEDMIAEGDKVMCRNVWRWIDKEARGCSSMGSFFGDSTGTRSPSDGRPLLRLPRKK
jgi:hypothetical protein